MVSEVVKVIKHALNHSIFVHFLQIKLKNLKHIFVF